MNAIKTNVQGGEQALKLINPNTSYTLVKRLEASISRVTEVTDEVVAEIESFTMRTKSILARVMHEMHNPSGKDAFFKIIKEFFAAKSGVLDIASKFEECGPSIGDELTKLRVVNILKSGLTKVSDMDDEMLEEIREAFSIMDMMSEDSWPDTKVEIMKEINNIEVMVGKCIVTLQGFDLLRQILEHRYNEGLVIDEQLDDIVAGNVHWAGLKDALYEKIGQHLVTDQEKAAYSFYLPEGFKQHGQVERHEPGDVLLF